LFFFFLFVIFFVFLFLFFFDNRSAEGDNNSKAALYAGDRYPSAESISWVGHHEGTGEEELCTALVPPPPPPLLTHEAVVVVVSSPDVMNFTGESLTPRHEAAEVE
jgi:hypothetical protein